MLDLNLNLSGSLDRSHHHAPVEKIDSIPLLITEANFFTSYPASPVELENISRSQNLSRKRVRSLNEIESDEELQASPRKKSRIKNDSPLSTSEKLEKKQAHIKESEDIKKLSLSALKQDKGILDKLAKHNDFVPRNKRTLGKRISELIKLRYIFSRDASAHVFKITYLGKNYLEQLNAAISQREAQIALPPNKTKADIENTVGHISTRLSGIYVLRENDYPVDKTGEKILQYLAEKGDFTNFTDMKLECSEFCIDTAPATLSELQAHGYIQITSDEQFKITPKGHYVLNQLLYDTSKNSSPSEAITNSKKRVRASFDDESSNKINDRSDDIYVFPHRNDASVFPYREISNFMGDSLILTKLAPYSDFISKNQICTKKKGTVNSKLKKFVKNGYIQKTEEINPLFKITEQGLKYLSEINKKISNFESTQKSPYHPEILTKIRNELVVDIAIPNT